MISTKEQYLGAEAARQKMKEAYHEIIRGAEQQHSFEGLLEWVIKGLIAETEEAIYDDSWMEEENDKP